MSQRLTQEQRRAFEERMRESQSRLAEAQSRLQALEQEMAAIQKELDGSDLQPSLAQRVEREAKVAEIRERADQLSQKLRHAEEQRLTVERALEPLRAALAQIDADAWAQPRLMAFLQAQGNIEPEEMARTFNCGIGMVLAVAADDVAGLIADLQTAGETVHVIGAIEPGERGCTVRGSAEAWSARAAWEAVHLA